MSSPPRAAAILLRRYEEAECGTDGYPLAWRTPAGPYLPRIPDLVRLPTGERCERCLHPYRTKETPPEWSPCDERCRHKGPLRVNVGGGDYLTDLDGSDEYTAAEVIAGYTAPVEAQWRVLTVHHLTGDKADCRWWNLAALCQRCHLYVQGRVRMDQIYPYEHTPWFKPHAAGYYAATYLGLDLSRGQVAERQEELLALERAA